MEMIDIGNLHFHFLSYSSLSVQHHEFLDVFASNGPSWSWTHFFWKRQFLVDKQWV